MRLVCPACTADYDVPAEALGHAGRDVRCARCGTRWFAAAPGALIEAEAQPAPLPAAAPEPPAPKPAAKAGAPRPVPLDAGGVSGWAVMALLALALGAAALWRTEVVRAAPDSAGLYAALRLPVNVRGVAIRDVAAAIAFENGQPVTTVEGVLENVTAEPLALSRLRYAVRAGDGREIVAWAGPPPRPTLGPGEALAFRGRLTQAVADGNDIEVRFVGARDARAGGSR